MKRKGDYADLPDFALVSIREVQRLLGISRSAWLEGVKKGYYPPPIRLTPRTVRWRIKDIRRLVENAANGNGGGAGMERG